MVRANTFGETTGEIFDAARRRLDTIRPMPFEDMQGMGEFVMNRMLADKREGLRCRSPWSCSASSAASCCTNRGPGGTRLTLKGRGL